ncbi:MAG: 1,4-dihydroxy-6-naphthoate synthase [Nitrospiraceae bacterium]|nr:1,4-dihydroxy-6-naphthoate synthase [Nitrospiraceae bacterium]
MSPRTGREFLSLGYSPCPNDTFIFYALVHGRIETGGLSFKEQLEDVEALNQKALGGQLDVTKISFHAYCRLRDEYVLLRSGAALGKGCGPLLVGREPMDPSDLPGRLKRMKIAIPGGLTTASLLLLLYGPGQRGNTIPMIFSDIMPAVKEGRAEAGLVIHEGRFTFENYGLHCLLDLGQWWERETGRPIPLGGIIAKRALGEKTIKSVQAAIRESILYSIENPDEARAYIRGHAQELEDKVIQSHIGLYVNDHTLWLGDDGERAIEELFRRAAEAGLSKTSSKPIFI